MGYAAVVIIAPDSGHFFEADGQATDVLVVDGREPESEMAAAEWCALQLDKVASLPPSSNVRVSVEQFVGDIGGAFGVSQADIDAERFLGDDGRRR